MGQVQRSRAFRVAFWFVAGLFALYAARFIERTSFHLGDERYFVLFDDAMISMRYASNLAGGHGLVWNPGEPRVEGFTNPLWTLFMAAVHLLPLAASKTSLVVQVGSLLLLVANLVLVRALAFELSRSDGAALAAVGLTAAYFPLNNWALQGMEVGLLAAWATGCSLLLLRGLGEQRRIPVLCVALGAGTLIRIDAIVLAVGMTAIAAWAAPARWRAAAMGGSIVGAFVAAQTAGRLAYYGELLPNTYYLKMAGYPLADRLSRGLASLVALASASGGLAVLPLLAPLVRRERPILVLSSIVGLQMGYSLYVGGDSWEWYGGSNRFVSIVMPVGFVLLSVLLRDLTLVAKRKIPFAALVPAAALAFAAIVVLLNRHGGIDATARRWLVVERPVYFTENRRLVATALRLRRMTGDDARLAVVWAGSVPYFSGRRCVDLLGKNDKTIARRVYRSNGAADPLQDYEPGHSKWDYRYSIGRLRPDVIVHTWNGMDSKERGADYVPYDLDLLGSVYLLKGSTAIQLDPNDLLASTLWTQGTSLERLGRRDQALALYRRAIETGAYNEGWRYHFGELFVRSHPLGDVEEYYRNTASADPKPQTSQYFWGLALARAGRAPEAADRFGKALEIDPAHEMTQVAWGQLLAAEGRWDEALVHLREAVTIFPDFAAAYRDLAKIYRRLGRAGDALRCDALARSSDPNTPRRFRYWGRYLLAHGRPQAAIPELEKALFVDPDDAEARTLLDAAKAVRAEGCGSSSG
jgi:tetratricopeptide (TPR) repeat protein